MSLADYDVLERIGEGSFGRVHRGRRRFTGQFVALKFIATAARAPDELAALRSEVAILRRLDHPHIVLLLDCFETRADIVCVTELCHGELLGVLAADGALARPAAARVAAQLVSALAYLAAAGVMHRDLKPQNVLVGARGAVKLADFGFACELHGGAGGGALLHSIKGTPLYMAPELFAAGSYTPSADVWALGALVFELAAGRPPFYAASLAELLKVIVADAPVELPREWDGDEDLRDFVRACLARDPAARPSWDALARHPFVAGLAGV
jgi:fused-like protein